MDINAFYDKIGGDYAGVLRRFSTEALAGIFVKKFSSDETYRLLMQAIGSGNIEESFQLAHKLKGIAANMGFTALYEACSSLVEQLRSRTSPAQPALAAKLEEEYTKIIDAISAQD